MSAVIDTIARQSLALFASEAMQPCCAIPTAPHDFKHRDERPFLVSNSRVTASALGRCRPVSQLLVGSFRPKADLHDFGRGSQSFVDGC